MPDPLASQLRSIMAVNDRSEFILFPIEIRFIASEHGKGGRAALRAAIIDPRRLTTLWMADVYSDDEEKFTPALLTSLAEHLATSSQSPEHSPQEHAQEDSRHTDPRRRDRPRDHRSDTPRARRRGRVSRVGPSTRGRRRGERRGHADPGRDARLDRAHAPRAQGAARDAGGERIPQRERRYPAAVRSLCERAPRAHDRPRAATTGSTSCSCARTRRGSTAASNISCVWATTSTRSPNPSPSSRGSRRSA